VVADGEIAAVLRQENSSEDKVTKLIELANQAGGKDNVTVIAGQLPT